MDKDDKFLEKMSLMVDGKKRASVEIRDALWMLSKSHGLTYCKVWIPFHFKNENKMCVTKFCGYRTDGYKDYYDACVKIQDGWGRIALKALQTYQSYFTINLNRCCLGICLRNINTGNFDYAFEFIFSLNDNNTYVFLDSLFVKLRSCLPSFKFSHGANIERQSLVMDVDTVIALEKQEEDCKIPRPIEMFNMDAINRARVEILEAVLNTLIESHGLTLCQVWHHRYDKTQNEKCAIKLGVYCAPGFKDYYDACVKIQDGSGGLALKTLETYQPYFSRNIIKGVSATTAKSSCCLAICLSNIYTADTDYAFEFFFSSYQNNEDPCVFLESLLLTLQSCLPSFKCSSGVQLGQHLRVLDADNPAQSFNFLALKNQEEDDDCMEEQPFGTPDSTNLNDRGDLRAMDVRFYVPASLKIADLKTKIRQRFHLVSNAFRLTYSFQGVTRPFWIQLENNQDLKKCISLCRSKKITQLPTRVVPCPTAKPEIRAKSRNVILNISRRLIY